MNSSLRELLGLIYNAIDAIEESECENPKIKIQASCDEQNLYIRVYDNGCEIKDENLVFEAFKTKEIINAHKGELKFEIWPKNFYFVLPLY